MPKVIGASFVWDLVFVAISRRLEREIIILAY
jgi:hypothetical protein